MQISAYLLLELMSNTLCLLTIMPQYVCCEKCCKRKSVKVKSSARFIPCSQFSNDVSVLGSL